MARFELSGVYTLTLTDRISCLAPLTVLGGGYRGAIGAMSSFRRMNQSVQGGSYWASVTGPMILRRRPAASASSSAVRAFTAPSSAQPENFKTA